MQTKQTKRAKIHRKIRMKLSGTKARPRLCVFRSQSHMYAQLIDDENGKVLFSVNDMKMKKGKKTEHALEIGKTIAKEAQAKKITTVVFDRAGFVFHGRIKAVADGAREGGLQF